VVKDPKPTVVAPSYTYRAVVVSVYDGVTITVDVDCGFGVWLKGQKIRLASINTPSPRSIPLRGDERDEGLEARDALRAMLPGGRGIVISTQKDQRGKFGRWIAEVYYPTYSGDEPLWINANEMLVMRGLAKRVMY